MATSEKTFGLVPRGIVPGKTARTICLVLTLASLPLFLPSLQRPLSWKGAGYEAMLPDVRELVSFKSNRSAPETIGSSNTPAADAPMRHDPADPCAAGLIDDPARALDHFYASLANTEAKKTSAITRITHYGDSPITNDGITGTTRRLLQEQFGDAGHGFILVDRPWEWYGHQAITFTSSGGWSDDSLMNPMTKDGMFGLGGVTFHASPGKTARFAPATSGDTGKNFSRMDVYYLAQPGGGQFSVSINGETNETVSTSADMGKSAFREIKAAKSGANTFEIKTVSGSVRMFGAVLENDGPGVVYDSLGVNGAYAGLLARVMNESHWAEQLQHRQPDLLILNYGTNESEYASDDQMARYERDLREVVRRVRAALPTVSILIVSPMDRGKHAAGGRVITLDSIPKIVEMQHTVARDTGCGFLNLYAAMGGEGTMARWHDGKHHLVGGDLTHPNADGAITVGVLIYHAIVEGFAEYRARTKALEQSAAAQSKPNNKR
jgi:lysophospholipase L1-like esterase